MEISYSIKTIENVAPKTIENVAPANILVKHFWKEGLLNSFED
jgi:hypothetical protein